MFREWVLILFNTPIAKSWLNGSAVACIDFYLIDHEMQWFVILFMSVESSVPVWDYISVLRKQGKEMYYRIIEKIKQYNFTDLSSDIPFLALQSPSLY